MNEREISFESALHWHDEGIQVSLTARSVHHTQVILNELNEAIELLQRVRLDGPGICDDFLSRHIGAPYK